MKTSLFLAAVAVVGCNGRSLPQEFDGVTAMRYVETQLSFGPRVPNTDGHRLTGNWIAERLRATADSVTEQTFEHITRDGDTLTLRNFIGHFRPELTERILYVAHWDTRPRADKAANLGEQRQPVPGANDGASGAAILLGVADVLADAGPMLGVDLLFVDGEDFGDFTLADDVLLGSRYYAEHLDQSQPLPLFAVVWDMVGDRELRIPQESSSFNFAPEVVRRVWDKADDLGYRREFPPSVESSLVDDHHPLQQAGIRAIVVIDFSYGPNNGYWHTLQDTADKVSAESLQIVGDVAVALLR